MPPDNIAGVPTGIGPWLRDRPCAEPEQPPAREPNVASPPPGSNQLRMEEGRRISRVTFVEYAEQKALPLWTPRGTRGWDRAGGVCPTRAGNSPSSPSAVNRGADTVRADRGRVCLVQSRIAERGCGAGQRAGRAPGVPAGAPKSSSAFRRLGVPAGSPKSSPAPRHASPIPRVAPVLGGWRPA